MDQLLRASQHLHLMLGLSLVYLLIPRKVFLLKYALFFVLLQPYGFLNLMTAISLFSLIAGVMIILFGLHTRGKSLEEISKESQNKGNHIIGSVNLTIKNIPADMLLIILTYERRNIITSAKDIDCVLYSVYLLFFLTLLIETHQKHIRIYQNESCLLCLEMRSILPIINNIFFQNKKEEYQIYN